MRGHRAALHSYLVAKMGREGRVLREIDPERPFEVHSIRPSTGTDEYGRPNFRWIVELLQSVPARLDPEGPDDIRLPGGCTLVVDGRTGRVRYTIGKPLDGAHRERRLAYLRDRGADGLAATYFTDDANEPFAMLHRG
jgi:hypothetical protein